MTAGQPSPLLVPNMDADFVKLAIVPLRLIFLGSLFCLIDIVVTAHDRSLAIDLVSDDLGAVLFAAGVFQLAEFSVHGRYTKVMRFVQAAAICHVLMTLPQTFCRQFARQFAITLPPIMELGIKLSGVVAVVAVVAFCVAMRWLCEEARLPKAARSWLVTAWLFAIIHGLWTILLLASSAVATGAGTSLGPRIKLGDLGMEIWWLLAISLGGLIPLIQFFISTSRMKRPAKSAGRQAGSEMA